MEKYGLNATDFGQIKNMKEALAYTEDKMEELCVHFRRCGGNLKRMAGELFDHRH